MFKDGHIDGVILKDFKCFGDDRGWLAETFRSDDVEEGIVPAMSYVSMTLPGTHRGPHEHLDQTDYFAFPGTSSFLVMLWDGRKESKTYMNRMIVVCDKKNRRIIGIPPRVIHGYANMGTSEGLVVNYPDRLFKGRGKKEQVDEVRYETDLNSPYVIDFLDEIGKAGHG